MEQWQKTVHATGSRVASRSRNAALDERIYLPRATLAFSEVTVAPTAAARVARMSQSAPGLKPSPRVRTAQIHKVARPGQAHLFSSGLMDMRRYITATIFR